METQRYHYHLVWTTFGTWLHGDARGWVKSGVAGIQAPDTEREIESGKRMAQDAVVLNAQQRQLCQETIRAHCKIRGWTLHAVNVRSNHVHVVLTAERSANEAMNQLKAWCSRRLSDHSGLTVRVARNAGRRRWWTEHGCTKAIHDEDYLHKAIEYVSELQGE